MAAIVVQVVFILWWTRVIQFWEPFVHLKTGEVMRLDLAPVWESLYWPVVALSLGVIAVRVMRLVERGMARVAYGLDIVLQVGVLIAAAVALKAGHWVDVTGSGLAAERLSKVDVGVNIGFEIGLIVVGVAAVGTMLYDIWRLLRPREG